MKKLFFTTLLFLGIAAGLWISWPWLSQETGSGLLAFLTPETGITSPQSGLSQDMPSAPVAELPTRAEAGPTRVNTSQDNASEPNTSEPNTSDEVTPSDVYVPANDSTVSGTAAADGPSAEPVTSQRDATRTGAHTLQTIYTRPPDIARCDPGVLAPQEKAKVLTFVNEIRSRHNLPPVRYAPEFDSETAQSSLIIAANNYMTHFPEPSSVCYSEAGAEGSATSNIAWGGPQEGFGEPLLAPSTVDVRNWFIDDGVPDLGHRRWILDPFLKFVSYGRVDGPPAGYPSSQIAHGAALKVIFDEKAELPDSAPAFVAYPYQDYPLDLVKLDWYWSFAVLADPTSLRNNQDVDYSQARIRVSGPGGDLNVSSVSFNNEGYGLPNHLQWRVAGAKVGETHQVLIDNVFVNGQVRSYAYDVTIVGPPYSRTEAPVEEVLPGETVEIQAGETIGIYANPSMSWPNGFRTSSQRVKSQSRSASPYVTLFWLDGTIGDQLRIPFSSGEVLLRITASRDGEQDPSVALSQDLSMPVYVVSEEGQEIVVEGPGEFAVYIAPTAGVPGDQSIGRVRWTYETGVEVDGQILNDHTLTFSLDRAPAGARIEVTYGEGKQFTLRIAGDPVQGLQEQLGVPIYQVEGLGERIQVDPSAYFALYLPEQVGRLSQVSWRASQGLQMEGVVFSGQALILQIQQAQPGMQATIDLGGGRTVILEIIER